MKSNLRLIEEFLMDTRTLVEQADALPFETAAELYDMYETAVKVINDEIAMAGGRAPVKGTLLRAQLCIGLDSIMDRISDFPVHLETTHRNVYTPCLELYGRWYNFQLMKDCGLSVYLLSREMGMHPVMLFGTKPEDYPYLEILKGLEMLCTDDEPGLPDTYLHHLIESYPQMDALVLYGMYKQSTGYLNLYRESRPDGKVYCGLDMNTYWMKHIDWDDFKVKRFARQCDLVATSCRQMRDILNNDPRTAFNCHWLPNGFFNPADLPVTAEASVKENIILTVSRIGTVQKNNGELLIAFSRVCDDLPGWKLHLAGPIDERFEPFIEEYFIAFPNLKGKVVFTGAITDKAELYEQYAKAKIFVLTSTTESGTPNVYAEALYHGCMFITSDIDAADDVTNYGQLGMSYKLRDIDALANTLMAMCTKADGKAFERHIPRALAYANKYYDWERNARKIAYMLYR